MVDKILHTATKFGRSTSPEGVPTLEHWNEVGYASATLLGNDEIEQNIFPFNTEWLHQVQPCVQHIGLQVNHLILKKLVAG